MSFADVVYPLLAGLAAATAVLALGKIAGTDRDSSVELDVAVLIGAITAFSVLTLHRPDWLF
jgi:hypothetical protein